MNRAWIFLIIAGLLEVVWATSMKASEGFTRLWPSIATFAAMFVSFVLLAIAMRALPLGTAYGVWTGIGAVGAAAVGILFFHESADPLRLLFIAFILIGIVGLKFVGDS